MVDERQFTLIVCSQGGGEKRTLKQNFTFIVVIVFVVRQNSSIHGPIFAIVLFILIIFLLIILLDCLYTLIQHFVIDRPDFFDNFSLHYFSLAINTYNVLLQLKSVDNNKASFLLNF